MHTCTVCGESFQPMGRWQEDTCPACFHANFRASDEMRLRGDAEPASLVLSPREVQALARFHAHHQRVRREEE